MKLRTIILPALILVLGLLLGRLLLAPLLSSFIMTQTSPLIIVLLYYAALPALTAAGAVLVLVWLRGGSKETRHRLEILTVLRTHVQDKGSVEYSPHSSESSVDTHSLQWLESHRLYPYAMEHLKSYDDLNALLNQAKIYSEKVIQLEAENLQRYKDLIDERLETVDKLPAVDTPRQDSKPFYVKQRVRYAVFRDVKSLQAGGVPFNPLGIEHERTGRKRVNQLFWGSELLAAGSAVALTKLQKNVKSLQYDSKVNEIVARNTRLGRLLQENPALDEFEARKALLVDGLSEGRDRLKGKCDLCP